ncbi:MAG: type I restriction-modification system subunit M N-terminal domain-containing protein [Chloroflexi bacterium]|nr:type I restriction-modification system subunit M N-terminal domain-containing protein [Chloroflexota bacterium]
MARKTEAPGARAGGNGATLGFEAKLWEAADKLRNNMDAAEYKHVVLGLIFLKYISDAFEEQQGRLVAEQGGGADPEDPDEYRAINVLWVPKEARWAHLQANAKQATIGRLIDDAMVAIKRDNPSLKGVLPKDYARPALDKQRLGELIDLVATIGLGDAENRSKDILGRVYEYFLAQFASAEGKKGGQFYTPRCVVQLHTGLPQHIADLFADSFEDWELGEVPRGWRVSCFGDTVEKFGGGTPKTCVKEFWDGDILWFAVGDSPEPGQVFVIDTEKKITAAGLGSCATRILPVGTTIISARGTVGKVALLGLSMAMNQSCYGLRGANGRGDYYTYFSTCSVVARLQQHSHGSVFDTVTRDTFRNIAVPGAPREPMLALEETVTPMLNAVLARRHESRTLAALRDALLPKLTSGEIRVKGVEKTVGCAV